MLFRNKISRMYTSMKKIQRDKEVEKSVAQALFELKNTHQELKSELKDLLYIKSANQIDVSGNRKAVVIRFPYRLRKPFRKIHDKLVRELETKWSGKDVVFIATKRIVRPRKKSFSAHVRIAILEDIVHPAKIKGIKGSYRPDGSPIITARNETEHKLKTFRRVYWKVWGRNVYFKFSDTSMKKIQKDKGVEPTMFEESVAKALFDLESTHQELKSDLKDLYIKSAVEIYVSRKRKAVVIHVPYALRKQFRKIHTKLVTELGKKLWAKDVIFIATREKGFADQRRTRRAMLKDIVYPAEILGSEILGRGAGERFFLDAKDLNDRECEECKLQTFCRVYWELTGEIVFIEYRVGDTECI